MFYSLLHIHYSHATYLTQLVTACYSTQFVHQFAFTRIDFRTIFFSRGTSLMGTATHAPQMTWNETLTNHLLG